MGIVSALQTNYNPVINFSNCRKSGPNLGFLGQLSLNSGVSMRKKILALSGGLILAVATIVPFANAQSSVTITGSSVPPLVTTTATETPQPPTTTPTRPTEPSKPAKPTEPTEPTEPTTPAPSVAAITDFEAESALIGDGNGVNIDLTWDAQGSQIDRFEVDVHFIEESQLGSFECREARNPRSLNAAGDQRSISMTSPNGIAHSFCLRALDQSGTVLATSAVDKPGLTSNYYPNFKPEIYVENYPGNSHHYHLYIDENWELCHDGTFIHDCYQQRSEVQISTDPSFPEDDPTTRILPNFSGGTELPGETGINYARLRHIDMDGNATQWSDPVPYLAGRLDETWGVGITL